MRSVESKFEREMKTRIVKEYMDMFILNRLRNVPSSGYDILAYIHQKTDIYVSSGIVYSTLYSLERQGLVKGKSASSKRLYSITQNGLDYIKNIQDNLDGILGFMKEILK